MYGMGVLRQIDRPLPPTYGWRVILPVRVDPTLTVKRQTRAMPMFRFILGMVLACYVGFSRLFHLRFLQREPMLTGILQVAQLPPQCTFWRFLASLHLGVAQQLLTVQRQMRQRVWEAGSR